MPFEYGEKPKLGEMLLEAKLITEDQLQTALRFQKSKGGRLGEIIEDLGFVDEKTMLQLIAQQQELPIVNVEEMVLPQNLIKRIPLPLMEKYVLLPVGFRDDVITVAMSDPTDYEAIEQIQLVTNWRVEVVLAPRGSIKKCLERIPRSPDTSKPMGQDTSKDLEALIQLLIEKNIITQEELKRKLKRLK